MRTTVGLIGILLLGLSTSCAQHGHESQPGQGTQPSGTSSKAAAEQPAKPSEIKAEPIRRVKQWQPAEGGSIMLTRGVAMKMINGSLTGLEADPGFELAVIRLNVTRGAGGSTLPLDDVSAYDDKGKKYASAVGGLPPLGKDANETREFAFAVPTGTTLKKIELGKNVSVDLK